VIAKHANTRALLIGLLCFWQIPPLLAQNVLVNGNFETGNTGFTSGYTYSTFGNGTYTITTDPSIPYPSSISFHDHTSGSGNMLTADGALTPGVALWASSVQVVPNTAYTFSGWGASWGNDGTGHDPNPANLQLLINGVPVGTASCPSVDGVWTPFTFAWSSGSATSADIKIVDLNTVSFGNDPCLDDLSFSVVPEPSTCTLFFAGGLLVAITQKWRKRHAA
jgi:hypothetical protein